jgi:hypothetical protein
MSTRHSGREKHPLGFYSEPPWAIESAFRYLPRLSALHNPCCGLGVIVDVARALGIAATGSDIADHGNGRFPLQDFLSDSTIHPNIMFNPPYAKTAARFIRHALEHVPIGRRVLALVALNFLGSQGRWKLMSGGELDR